MNIDIDYLYKEGVFQENLQQKLYSVRIQKKYIDEKISQLHNRIKLMQDEEKKQQTMIMNLKQGINKKKNIIDFKDQLSQYKAQSQRNKQEQIQSDHHRASTFRNRHKQLLNDLQYKMQSERHKAAQEMYHQRKKNKEQIDQYRSVQILQKQDMVKKLKDGEKHSQDLIHSFWKQKLTFFLNQKLSDQQDMTNNNLQNSRKMAKLLKKQSLYQQEIQNHLKQTKQLSSVLNDSQQVRQWSEKKLTNRNSNPMHDN